MAKVNPVINGLLTFSILEGQDVEVNADDDTIYAGTIPPEKHTEEVRAYLTNNGWWWDE